MIPQLIEKKIIDAINAAISPVTCPIGDDGDREAVESRLPVQIFGAWQPSAIGYLKNQQESSTVATIAVAIGTAMRQTFTSVVSSYNGAITLSIRAELDPTGDALLKLAAPLEALFAEWQGATYQTAFTALDVPGFSVGDIFVQGGEAPRFDFNARTISLSWNFTLSGSDAD